MFISTFPAGLNASSDHSCSVCVTSSRSFSSSAGQQARRVVDETAKLVWQVSVVFRQEAAHFYTQEVFGEILHDGSCRSERK